MKKLALFKSSEISAAIINICTCAAYFAICVIYYVLCSRHTLTVAAMPEATIWQILQASAFNSISTFTAIIDAILAFAFAHFRKDFPRKQIIAMAVLFYCSCLFNLVVQQYPVDQALVSLINMTLLPIFMLILLPFQRAEQIGRSKYLGALKNKLILSAQLYCFKREVKGASVSYELSAMDHVLRPDKSDSDLNGILSVTYTFPLQDETTFQVIQEAYWAFLDDGDDKTKAALIGMLTSEIDTLTKKLGEIVDVANVTSEHCCQARILLIYRAFYEMLIEPEKQSGGENYIGELSIGEGCLGIPTEVEKRLFTLKRTGLLGAVLLGNKLRYLFSYHKDGLKTGRHYSATRLPDAKGEPSNMICAFTLAKTTAQLIPPYMMKAIAAEEERILKSIHKLEGSES